MMVLCYVKMSFHSIRSMILCLSFFKIIAFLLLLIQVGFVHPRVAASVMVYLASDGSWSGDQCRRTATILLCDTTGKNHSLGMFYLY